MLQLGLLRVITWPSSRFKKQRIKAQCVDLNEPGKVLDYLWLDKNQKNLKLTLRFTKNHLFYWKLHFQKLQDRHKLCILRITLFAYGYLFKQQRNLHDEYPVNKNLLNKKGSPGTYPQAHGQSTVAAPCQPGLSTFVLGKKIYKPHLN